jgi:alkanesulfonate monooxygenase SsuD/methylene tetrahydromethanopterin reductase-like flavin-dependent oxidoreductase (luciferase family)
MKFSMIFEAQLAHPTPERERQLIHDCIEQAVLAEQVGFDRIWAVEHHALKWYAHMSAPEIFLTAVAARTSRIRIGHGVVCMPFNYNYPTRVAERAAMLDIVSNGRLDLGAGRGGIQQELSLCNVDPERAYLELEEALRIIGRAWQEETFSWDSDLLTIKAPEPNQDHTIVPRPVQTPHPPLFMACTLPDTVVRAANFGVGALVFGFAGLDSVREQRELYDQARERRTGEEFVSTLVNDHFSALCPTVVLEDGERAREIGIRGQRFFVESIMHWGNPGFPPPTEDLEGQDNAAWMDGAAQAILDRIDRGELPDLDSPAGRVLATAQYNYRHAHGTPETAIAYVEQLRDVGADEVMCCIQMGTVPQDVCLETIRLWGEQVIPRFRDRDAASAPIASAPAG